MNTPSVRSLPVLASALLFVGFIIVGSGCICPPAQNTSSATPGGVVNETPIADRPFTLYLLDGDSGRQKDAPEGETLHGWRILQQCPITSEQTRHDLFRALDDAIAAAPGRGSRCFIPRHAIRVQTNGVVVDYVICFQCGNYKLYEGDKSITGGGISRSPKPIFNRILSQCN
jgi:hypothetical protein